MALDSDQGERSEEATQQRREDFRKRGQVAQTRELSRRSLCFFPPCSLIWLFGHFSLNRFNDAFSHGARRWPCRQRFAVAASGSQRPDLPWKKRFI